MQWPELAPPERYDAAHGGGRYLLKFGDVTPYLGYNALRDYFPSMPMLPNPSCSNSHCRKRQAEHQVGRLSRPAGWTTWSAGPHAQAR